MYWRLLLVCSILLATCVAKGPKPEESEIEPRTSMPPVGSRVLLSGARGLAIEPKPDAPRVFGLPTELRVAEVVAHVGDLPGFVELRSVAALPHELCSAIGAEPSFELRFFASLAELEPVLAKPKQVEFEDGTRLAFVAGVPILGEGADARLRVDSVSFEVPLSSDEIARWFEYTPREGSAKRLWWVGHEALHYGDHELVGHFEFWSAPPHDTRSIEGGTLLSFANSCGDFTLRSDATESEVQDHVIPLIVRNFDPDNALRAAGILGLLLDDPRECKPWVRWTAPVGTKLWWRTTGTAAGVVMRETELPAGSVSTMTRSASPPPGSACASTGRSFGARKKTAAGPARRWNRPGPMLARAGAGQTGRGRGNRDSAPRAGVSHHLHHRSDVLDARSPRAAGPSCAGTARGRQSLRSKLSVQTPGGGGQISLTSPTRAPASA